MSKVQKLLSLLQKINKELARSYKTSTGFYFCAFISTKILGIKNPNVASRVVSNFLRSLAGAVQIKEANISLFSLKKYFFFSLACDLRRREEIFMCICSNGKQL